MASERWTNVCIYRTVMLQEAVIADRRLFPHEPAELPREFNVDYLDHYQAPGGLKTRICKHCACVYAMTVGEAEAAEDAFIASVEAEDGLRAPMPMDDEPTRKP